MSINARDLFLSHRVRLSQLHSQAIFIFRTYFVAYSGVRLIVEDCKGSRVTCSQ